MLMDARRLKNCLRTCRRRLGLTQTQLAFVLNLKSRARVTLLEQGRTAPSAMECLIFQKLFRRSAAELWPSWTAMIARDVDARIRHLQGELGRDKRQSPRQVERARYAVAQLAVARERDPQD